jgi:hypothetical protein
VRASNSAPAVPPTTREVLDWLRLFLEDGQRVEIRAPKVRGRTYARFTDPAAAANQALRWSGKAPGVYFTLNPVQGDIPANRAAKDADVLRRRWLLIDCDPTRPADTSATDAEKAAAIARAGEIREFLTGRGFPAPIEADSGNGGHLAYRIELPNDDQSRDLIKAVLTALEERFGTAAAKIDVSVYNASRICKLYGTKACKGRDTPERPHRYSRVTKVPATLVPVPAELLAALASEGQPVEGQAGASKPAATGRRAGTAAARGPRPSDVEARASKYLARCQPAISGQGGHNQTLKVAVEIGPGFDLAPDVAFRLLGTEWNPRCEPPWSERDLRRKVDEAYRIETRRGWHLLDGNANGKGKGNGRAGGVILPPTPSDPTPPGPVPPAIRATAGNGRPTIVITTEEHHVIDQAIAALAAEECVYQRGNALVTVLRDPSRVQREKIHRPKGSPRIVPLPGPRLRELLTKTAMWAKGRRDRDGDVELVPAHPPDWAVNGVAARGSWPEIRTIEAIIEAPALRPDGTILDVPGWDKAMELLYEPNAEFPPIPDRPDQDDAERAARQLLDLVGDFPFKGEEHRAAWLAALLTPLARFAIDGPCPLFLFDGNVPGVGKSKLTDVIAIVATGRDMPRTAYPDNDEEMRKRITATALAGDRLMLIDNIKPGTPLGGGSLDSTLTGLSWRDRKLGASEMTPDLPLFTVWFATGNNVELRGDMLRRTVPCRLESPEENPEERTGFAIEGDLLRHVREHRGRLVVAALTILRAHALAGRPAMGLKPMGSFESWSEVVRAAVSWAFGVDPCATRKELQDSDPESLARAVLIQGWSELPNAELGLTVSEALKCLRDDAAGRYATLRDCLLEISRTNDLPSPRVIGKRLLALKGRVVQGRCIQATPYQGAQVWKVVRV